MRRGHVSMKTDSYPKRIEGGHVLGNFLIQNVRIPLQMVPFYWRTVITHARKAGFARNTECANAVNNTVYDTAKSTVYSTICNTKYNAGVTWRYVALRGTTWRYY